MVQGTTTTDSKRWTHFHSALQLAINRAAHKWTYEDFQECFALWCKEEPHGAEGVFSTLSRHMEDQIRASCESLFEDLRVRENINALHAVVTEARARKERGELDGKDVWREDLDPRAAVRARTVPVLQAEVEQLRASLKKHEEENATAFKEIKSNVEREQDATKQIVELLKHEAEVHSAWNKLPHDEMDARSLETAESLGRRHG